jgi:mRNA interferase RelE/StbE
MNFKIQLTKSAVKDYSKINEPIKSQLKNHINQLQIKGLETIGIKPLTGNLKGLFRLRVGDYRIIFSKEENLISIISILHRKDVYK